jgi:hypothetical protein
VLLVFYLGSVTIDKGSDIFTGAIMALALISPLLLNWLSNAINEKGFTAEQHERRKRVIHCAKVTFRAPIWYSRNGSIVYQFENPGFALLFSTMNFGELSALPDRS